MESRQRATHATPPPLREPLPHILHVVDGKANCKCEIYLRESVAGGRVDLQNSAIR